MYGTVKLPVEYYCVLTIGARVSDNERFSGLSLACGMSKCGVRTFMDMWVSTQ